MKLLWVVVLVVFTFAAVAVACGDDDDGGSSNEITIIPDLSAGRAGMTEEETLELLQAIMERRAEFADGSAEVTINEDATLTVKYKDIASDIAEELYMSPANLEIRGPQRQGEDMVVCLLESGQREFVPFDRIVYDQTSARVIPRCRMDDGSLIDLAWENLETLNLGIVENLDIDSVALLTEAGPTLIVGFNQDGRTKIASVTARLIDLPMGVFIDGELVVGPRVGAIIENGQIPIAGLSLREARTLRAQLRAGALPAPYTMQVSE